MSFAEQLRNKLQGELRLRCHRLAHNLHSSAAVSPISSAGTADEVLPRPPRFSYVGGRIKGLIAALVKWANREIAWTGGPVYYSLALLPASSARVEGTGSTR